MGIRLGYKYGYALFCRRQLLFLCSGWKIIARQDGVLGLMATVLT